MKRKARIAGHRLGFGHQPAHGLGRVALVHPRRVQSPSELLDAELFQGAHQCVAAREVPVEGGAADAGGLGDLVHGRGRLAGEQGRCRSQDMVTVNTHETTITRMRR
ncbi:hypothetical protein GCM10020000_65810 [Streptomyces olivoverticillatus]